MVILQKRIGRAAEARARFGWSVPPPSRRGSDWKILWSTYDQLPEGFAACLHVRDWTRQGFRRITRPDQGWPFCGLLEVGSSL